MLDMSNITNLVTENWRLIAIVVAVGAYFGWDKVKALVGKVKLPSTIGAKKTDPTVIDYKAIEAADVAAIALLRDRAVESKNDALLKEVKNVSSQFFDLHCVPTRINSKSV